MENELWTKVLNLVSHKMSRPSFETWFKTSKAIKEEKRWVIISESEFTRDWLEQRYSDLVKEAIFEITNESPELVFTFKEKHEQFPI
ncbi:hypothetical protein NC797_16935 [Aquibacillus sp. 3ASR75-11]|uniref:DnaA N-terminal domain-containing protein n=1 Tax=Terrihalobacillus insolitus TaxID=2950438 RepID=A0A9X3WZK7_9BACI|nr:DnaA N-terminal domain-containing protein [Terrihalobacillus insolitus]MDC3413530.1 hypothetical protein [Terrihalobacillus insolitus]MDC3426184.1 hypothetical protein [Terrihalobacillus insolitus]